MGRVYAVSDIHGRKERYDKLLEMLKLSGDDKLYILGDIIDRGEDGVEILVDALSNPNIEVLMGNHEKMMLDALDGKVLKNGSKWSSVWTYRDGTGHGNGGDITYLKLMEYRENCVENYNELIRKVRELPKSKEVKVNGKKFLLVHGGIKEWDKNNVKEDLGDDVVGLWVSPTNESTVPEHYGVDTVIVGHTITYRLRHGMTVTELADAFKIYHGDGWIDIDCGCAVGDKSYTCLGCLALDTMEEIYIQ